MKPIKLPYLLFSIAVIAALVAAAIPTAPAYALSDSASQVTSISASDSDTPALHPGEVVCKSKVIWRDGKRVTVRVCARVHRPHR